MFCANCGTQIKDDAKFCHNCGNPVGQNSYQQQNAKQQNNAYQAPNAQRPTASYGNEQVKCGVNLVYPDGRSEIGDIYISATEIVFVKKSKGVMLAFGSIGRALQTGEERMRFNVSDIVGGKRTRIGINPNVYQITLRSGEIYKLCLDKPKIVSYLEGRFG